MIPKEVAEAGCKAEKAAWIVYSELAKSEKNEKVKKLLTEIAEEEKRHYEFWKKLLERDCKVRVPIFLIKLIRKIFGLHFVLKKFESGEELAIEFYENALKMAGPEEKEVIEQILEEEKNHENKLIEMVEDVRAKYVGYIALGLADSVVEITGVHAGFLGATDNPLMAGLAGIIVGFSASLSMAGAAYVQAKHDPSVKPPVSAAVTMTSYLLSVILLALPYFILKSVWDAFAASLVVAMIIMGTFMYYSTTIQGKDFKREYLETLVLLFSTAFGSYLFGAIIESFLHIKAIA